MAEANAPLHHATVENKEHTMVGVLCQGGVLLEPSQIQQREEENCSFFTATLHSEACSTEQMLPLRLPADKSSVWVCKHLVPYQKTGAKCYSLRSPLTVTDQSCSGCHLFNVGDAGERSDNLQQEWNRSSAPTKPH